MIKVVKEFKNGTIGIKCNFCKGNGTAPNSEFDETSNNPCPVCKGKGFNILRTKIDNLTPCKHCNSSGRQEEFMEGMAHYYFLGSVCKACKGTGIIILKFDLSNSDEFDLRNFHTEVVKHGRELFLKRQWFHSVFEVCKAFEYNVKNISKIDNFGPDLMSKAFSPQGPLLISDVETSTGKSQQEGIMHLAMGIMKLIRNPVSHTPAKELAVKKHEALEILSMLSLIFSKLETTQKKLVSSTSNTQ